MPENTKPRLPGASHRIAIIGRTGSGKTVAALWHLSRKNLQAMPWVAVDFKTDENINAIEGAQHVGVDFSLPEKAKGLFVVHPLPSQEDEVNAFMWRLWERENVGVYLDEAYMADNEAFQAILTQGRSKRVPVIALTQRPVWCSRFLFSEADFIQCFSLNDERDRRTVESFVPTDMDSPLERYRSIYYDIGENKVWKFAPVPPMEKILARIDAQLAPKRRERVFV